MENRTILVTGCSGYLAQHVIKALKNNFPGVVIIGMDKKKPPEEKTIDKFYQLDIRYDLTPIFKDNDITDIIHFAWVVKPVHNRKYAYSIDINGTLNLITQANKANVEYFLHTSSTLAYGAHKDNPIPLTEDCPLRGNKAFHYSYHKALVEKEINSLQEKGLLDIKLGIVRPSPIISKDLENYITRILSGSWRTFFTLPYSNKETLVQFAHVEDIVSGYLIMIKKILTGAYNAVPNDGDTYGIKIGDIPKLLNKRGLRIPSFLLYALLKIQWFLRLSEAPPGYLDFIKYPFVASSAKLEKHGYEPKYSTADALKMSLTK